MDYQKILEDIDQEILPYADKGTQATYIPALADVDPDQFGISLRTIDGESYSFRQADVRFSIQSISKVFAVAMGLALKGESMMRVSSLRKNFIRLQEQNLTMCRHRKQQRKRLLMSEVCSLREPYRARSKS